MIADTTAYFISMLQVLGGAAVLILVFPLVMWHNYLKTKPYGYRFVFCVVTQNSLLINLVLLLGFLHICNRYTVLLCLAAVFLLVTWSLSDKRFFQRQADRFRLLKKLFTKEVTPLDTARLAGERLCGQARAFLHWPLWRHMARNAFEYLALAAAVVYNLWFLTYNVLRYHSYQFSDIPVHQLWIYQLDKGKLFGSGIYPFGMHAVVYLIHNLFSLDLREVLLYFGTFQTVLLLVSVYLLSRRIFRWKYSAVAALAVTSLLFNQGRFAASLPQECGMFSVALTGLCLLSFLQRPLRKYTVEGDVRIKRIFRINQYLTRPYLTTDLLLFMLCVALSIAYHFYTAIADCILVFLILAMHGSRIVRKQYWVPVLVTGALGVMIAVAPFMACYAQGTPFQESMQWAVSVINGQKWEGSNSDYQAKLQQSLGQSSSEQTTEQAESQTASAKTPMPATLSGKLRFYYNALFQFSKTTMYGTKLTKLLALCVALGFGCGLLLLPFRRTRPSGRCYLAMELYTVVLCTMGAAQTLQIVEIIAASRATTFLEPFLGIVYLIPADFVFGILSLYRGRIYRALLSAVSAALCAAMVFGIIRMGFMHHFFDVNIAYYNEPEYLTRHIRQDYPRHKFTVVSPTEEYYEVVDYGYHVELSKFIDMVDRHEAEFKIPTPYVFVFIEKKVLQDSTYGSVPVSAALASKKFVYLASSQDYYFQRAVLESKAYYWARAFQKMYPNTVTIYYDDPLYVVYLIKQNPYDLYNFQISYLSAEKEAIK